MATKNDPKALLNFIKGLSTKEAAAPQQALLEKIQKNLEEQEQLRLQKRIELAMAHIERRVQELQRIRKEERKVKDQIDEINGIVEKILNGDELTEHESRYGI